MVTGEIHRSNPVQVVREAIRLSVQSKTKVWEQYPYLLPAQAVALMKMRGQMAAEAG